MLVSDWLKGNVEKKIQRACWKFSVGDIFFKIESE
jgi:hypothetical protein